MSVCRLSIQTEHDGDVRTVDVAVCAQTPVAALLPAVNDVARLWPPAQDVHHWRLDRLVGGPLDDSLSLVDNGIRDGEVLVLTTGQAPIPRPVSWEPARVVAATGAPTREADEWVTEAVGSSLVLLAAAVLAWSAVETHSAAHVIGSACATAAVCWTAVRGRHRMLSLTGVTFAAVTGILAVPSGPAAPNVLLGAAAAFAAAVVMTRLSGRPSAGLTATATASAFVAAVTTAASFVALPIATIGAGLTTATLGLLALAPRVAMALSGLNTRHDGPPRTDDAHAREAHTILTGLIAGVVFAVVVGVAQVALGSMRSDQSAASVAFACAAGLVLTLRARTYVDTCRRVALVGGGLLAGSMALIVVVSNSPALAPWITTALAALGLGTLGHHSLSPLAKRAVDLLDYAALAAVVPLACWVAGGYALARELPLT